MRVLFLTHRLPYAPNRGDRIRAYHLLKVLRPHAAVDLVSLVHSDEEASHVAELGDLAATVTIVRVPHRRNLVRGVAGLVGPTPLTHLLLDAPAMHQTLEAHVRAHPPDVVLAYCSGIGRVALEPPLDTVPLVVDFLDVDSEKWRTLGQRGLSPLRLVYVREARTLGRFEARLAQRAHAAVVVNEKEAAALRTLAPGARVRAVPSGVELAHFAPPGPPADSRTVVFCGVMNYSPNEEAAVWLATQVWPQVLTRCPDARLQLVGSEPTNRVRRLASENRRVEVTGRVPDVRPFLWKAAVGAAPLLVARGIQNKVLEAVGAGLPSVVTPVVAEGLPPEVLPACRVAATADLFADSLVALLELSPEERRAVVAGADLAGLAWDRRLAPVIDLLREAADGTGGANPTAS